MDRQIDRDREVQSHDGTALLGWCCVITFPARTVTGGICTARPASVPAQYPTLPHTSKILQNRTRDGAFFTEFP